MDEGGVVVSDVAVAEVAFVGVADVAVLLLLEPLKPPLKLRWRLALNLHANSSQARRKTQMGERGGAKQFVICLLRLAFSAISIFAAQVLLRSLKGKWKMGARCRVLWV